MIGTRSQAEGQWDTASMITLKSITESGKEKYTNGQIMIVARSLRCWPFPARAER